MKDKFAGKYRNGTFRLQHWDYRWDAAYFVTICTADREHYFGKIENGNMKLSGLGVLADVMWHEIKNHTKNIELDAFVVMPNHIHGIIIINNDLIDDGNGGRGIVACNDPTITINDPTGKNQRMSSISPKSGSLSTIMRSYKSAVTKHARRLGHEFGWQRRFHEHIIRNEKSYSRIQQYIVNNPGHWDEDRFCE